MVHTCPVDPTRFLVIAVLFRVGPERDRFLDEFMSAIPRSEGEKGVKTQVDICDVFSPRDHYYVYDGSLTTPPYTERVQWLVRKGARQASAEQVAAFRTLEGDNARFVQPLSARPVEYQ